MKFRGQISINLPVGDYLSAVQHHRRLEDILAYVRGVYPEAKLTLRERRERKALELSQRARSAAFGERQARG